MRERMDKLARAVTMLRAGATLMQMDRGGWAWWGHCERCKRERFLQWCHIHSQGSTPALRWEPDNAFAGCAECHVFGRNAWHRDVTRAEEWLRRSRGDAAVDRLELRRRTVTKPDHAAQRLWLEAEVRRLGSWAWDALFKEGSAA